MLSELIAYLCCPAYLSPLSLFPPLCFFLLLLSPVTLVSFPNPFFSIFSSSSLTCCPCIFSKPISLYLSSSYLRRPCIFSKPISLHLSLFLPPHTFVFLFFCDSSFLCLCSPSPHLLSLLLFLYRINNSTTVFERCSFSNLNILTYQTGKGLSCSHVVPHIQLYPIFVLFNDHSLAWKQDISMTLTFLLKGLSCSHVVPHI